MEYEQDVTDSDREIQRLEQLVAGLMRQAVCLQDQLDIAERRIEDLTRE